MINFGLRSERTIPNLNIKPRSTSKNDQISSKIKSEFLKILPSTNVKYLQRLRILQETDCTFPG